MVVAVVGREGVMQIEERGGMAGGAGAGAEVGASLREGGEEEGGEEGSRRVRARGRQSRCGSRSPLVVGRSLRV